MAGLYYMSVYAEIDDGHNRILTMEKNNVAQCYARGETASTSPSLEEATSCSAVMELQPTDQVNVKINGNAGFDSVVRNGFTGFLIQRYI